MTHSLPEVVWSHPEMSATYKLHTRCRVCKIPLGKPYLDLGEQPLANALRKPDDDSHEFKYPLAIALCENCGLSQLTVVVDPEVLYSGYRFRSGTSEAWRKHCAELAEQCGPEGSALDIAANDGTMMSALTARGWFAMGIDPAPCGKPDQVIKKGEWNSEMAKSIPGTFNLVIAQNVLGHVDDPIGFLKGVKEVLQEGGQAVIEVPNVGNLIDDCAFDTIYHEHLSYWNGYGLTWAASQAGLRVDRFERLSIHGGSVRYWIEHEGSEFASPTPDSRHPGDAAPYALFGNRVAQRINQIAALLDDSRKKTLVAWGASAKGSVMLNAVHNRWSGVTLPEYVIDQTQNPGKAGMLMPGVHIPIVEAPEFLEDVDIIWVLSWNWLKEIKHQAKLRGFKGKYLVTSPRPALVD